MHLPICQFVFAAGSAIDAVCTAVLNRGMTGFERFIEILDEEPEIADRPGAIDLEDVTGHIEFKDVSFLIIIMKNTSKYRLDH